MSKLYYFKFYTLIAAFSFLLLACNSKNKPIPKDIIQPEKMTLILSDVQIIEATLLHIQQKDENPNNYKKNLYDLLFLKHNITKELLDTSINYYANNNITALDKIYADVITNLSQKQSIINNQ